MDPLQRIKTFDEADHEFDPYRGLDREEEASLHHEFDIHKHEHEHLPEIRHEFEIRHLGGEHDMEPVHIHKEVEFSEKSDSDDEHSDDDHYHTVRHVVDEPYGRHVYDETVHHIDHSDDEHSDDDHSDDEHHHIVHHIHEDPLTH